MTIRYNHQVATGEDIFSFWKLLFRWRGSLYKMILVDFIVYLVFFYAIDLFYRFYVLTLNANHPLRATLDTVHVYCEDVLTKIPLTYVLGFYVSTIVIRWWDLFSAIPWPDNLAILVAISVQGRDERGRMMRRTLLRYINLALAFTFTLVSSQGKARFPRMDRFVEIGLLQPHEKILIDHMNEKLEGPKYYTPLVWAAAIANQARKENRIRSDVALYHIKTEISIFYNRIHELFARDWICVPLVYTQTVILAYHVYFAACLFGRQLVDTDAELKVPFFHFLEFIFLTGWLKVAELMLCPLGSDDEHFEVNWMLDRNLTVSYLIVDEMKSDFPELVKDEFWEKVVPVPEEMYYTDEARKFKTEGYVGSAALATPAYNEPEINPVRDSVTESALNEPGRKSTGSLPPEALVRANSLGTDEKENADIVGLFDRSIVKYRDSDEDLREKSTAE